MKKLISDEATLIHEIAHLVDQKFKSNDNIISSSNEWKCSIEEDAKIRKPEDNLPSYYVSWLSERSENNQEDFADAFKYFIKRKEWFKINYNNRNRILEELWKNI